MAVTVRPATPPAADLNLALACIAELQPGQAVLSHIGHELDRWLLQHGQQLPAGVIVGREGLQI